MFIASTFAAVLSNEIFFRCQFVDAFHWYISLGQLVGANHGCSLFLFGYRLRLPPCCLTGFLFVVNSSAHFIGTLRWSNSLGQLIGDLYFYFLYRLRLPRCCLTGFSFVVNSLEQIIGANYWSKLLEQILGAIR